MTSYVDNVTDWFRAINAVLALICAGMILARSWADRHATRRLFSVALATFLFWQAYTSIEVIVLTTASDAASGIRVYGFTFCFALLLSALLIDRRRKEVLLGQVEQDRKITGRLVLAGLSTMDLIEARQAELDLTRLLVASLRQIITLNEHNDQPTEEVQHEIDTNEAKIKDLLVTITALRKQYIASG